MFVDGSIVEAALAIDEEVITWIGKESSKPSANKTISLDDRLVLPGIVDLHVHFRDQNLSAKETFSSGSRAAAMGGVTSVADMPNNDPPTGSPQALKQRMNAAEGKIHVNTAFYSLLSTSEPTIAALSRDGAIGFKFFMYNPLNGSDPEDDELLTRVFKILRKGDLSLAVHAESRRILRETASRLTEQELNDPVEYPATRPPRAEFEAVDRVTRIAKSVGNLTHLCHLSTRIGVDLVRKAKAAGVPVTCEVTPHHLLLSGSQMRRLGSKGIMNPPLRSKEDVVGLWEGVLDGTVDALASDHAPHERFEKELGSATSVPPGFPGLETLASTILTQVNHGRISLSRFVSLTSTNPARILGLKGRGILKKGYYADLIIVDLKKDGRIDPSRFESKAKYSPFEGFKTKGAVDATIVRGQVVMENGEIVAEKAKGEILMRERG